MSKCFSGLPEPGDLQDSSDMKQVLQLAVNDGAMVNRVGLSRKHIFDAVDASVRRLGTYIDVLQIHRLDRETPREEIMKALNDVVERGKVRYIGASSVWISFPSSKNIIADLSDLDVHLGVPGSEPSCREEWLAQIHQYARPPFALVSRRGTRDAPVLSRCRHWHYPLVAARVWSSCTPLQGHQGTTDGAPGNRYLCVDHDWPNHRHGHRHYQPRGRDG